MGKNILVGVILAALTCAVAWQGVTIGELRREITAGAREASQAPAETASPTSRTPARISPGASRAETRTTIVADESLNARVATLEDSVAQLNKASEYLMSRGQIPLTPARIAELQQKFMDVNATMRERTQALNLLRRNNGLSEPVIQSALSWISSATNNNLRESLVRELGGTTNSLLREPMMKLAMTDTDPNVREHAVQNLRRFLGDPQVNSMMWTMLRNEQDRGVKEQITDALRDAPITPARVAEMRNLAVNENSTLDERLLAVQTLRRSGENAEDITTALAQFVQSTQNPDERARVFSAFDGTHDPQMKLPLVYGLQDPNANVRARAADALSGYGSDPAVAEWLRYVAQNDADFRVRREAEQALREAQQNGEQGRRGRRDGPPGPGPRGERR
jgi:HEAT repeat protein